jgi:A118 family predicted phage portal protein
MTIDEFNVPAHVEKKLKELGYKVDTSMDSNIQGWYDWYSGNDEWYKDGYTDLSGRKRQRDRMSIRPAKRACREWASLLVTDDTVVSVAKEKANQWLQDYLDKANFWPTGQMVVEKAFAMGTAAWALWFDIGEDGTDVKVRRYDARMVRPLSWDEEGVSECAFVTRVSLRGKRGDQLQVHSWDADTASYHIATYLFVDGREQDADEQGIIADFDTRQACPTFGILKPALENTTVDLSPYGQSVFADAVDSIKAVDLAWDSIYQEVELTAAKVFVDESLMDVRSKDGKTIPAPKVDGRLFRRLTGQDVTKNLIDIYSPNIRIDPLRIALDVALAEFGDLCGFGQQYFQLDKGGGLKTATEVTSDNSALMRNVRKHENCLRGAIQRIVTALLNCARIHCGAAIEEDFGAVAVQFDDSVITDTQTEKNMAMAEIAALGLPVLKQRYLMDWYGMSAEEAEAAVPSAQVVDEGF